MALGEGTHGNEQGAAFRAKLYRDPRFQAVVNDVVVESGNGRHQAMMDRYIAGYPKGAGMTMRPGPNGPIAVDLGEAIGGVMQEQFDALLYLGPTAEITYGKLSRSLCADPEYVEMRASRLSAMRLPPGAPSTEPSPADAFRMRCKAAVEGKGSR